MDIGKYKAGTLKKQYGYSSFSPEMVNHDWLINDAKINNLLSDADRKLGELNAFSLLDRILISRTSVGLRYGRI